jgi:7,8-dihydro-6-hydroxymethylpterin dimethyltransferase
MHANDVKNDWGQLSCGCHPNCGTGMAVMIDKETKEAVPVTAFLAGDQLAKDIAKVNDAARGKFLTVFGMALCLMKNYDPFQAPTHFKMMDLLRKFDKNFNATGKNYGKVGPDRTVDDVMKRRQDRWNFLFIAGMWFQDLFNYDFRRTEQCIIPYATQEGEISFCAYNTGVGWRNIIEKMHMTATLTKWYEEHGRHEIFAGGKKVKMDDEAHNLLLRDDLVTTELQHDLDNLGIAKNSREEKKRARDAKAALAVDHAETPVEGHRGPQKNDEAYNARMASLYREVVLKEKPAVAENGFIPLGALGKANGNEAKAAKPEVAEPVAGD